MTTQTHTQGPWATYVDSAHDGWIACADGNLIACAVRNENMQANARLIAAAPQMRTALDSMVLNYAQSGRVTDEFVRDVARMLLEIDQ